MLPAFYSTINSLYEISQTVFLRLFFFLSPKTNYAQEVEIQKIREESNLNLWPIFSSNRATVESNKTNNLIAITFNQRSIKDLSKKIISIFF